VLGMVTHGGPSRCGIALTALSFLVDACGGGYTQEELDAAVESAVAEAMAKAATTTTPEVHVFDTMVDAMFQNVVAIAESERDAPQACKDNGSCGLPNAEGRVSEGLTSGTFEGDQDYAALGGLFSTDTWFEGLRELGFPGSTEARIGNTRALDGTLTAESSTDLEASWTYHPDDGLSIVIERR